MNSSTIGATVRGLLRARGRFGTACGAAVAVVLSAPAATAAENEQVTTLEEIVVTAQFRQTALQDTPIAITAVTGEMLDARSQTSVTDIANQAPNVVLKPSAAAFGPGVSAFIRGVGQYDTSFALEPGVGMYIDGVYYSTVLGSDFDLMDLERVEILRGPQGTLAGKNSLGGAVKLYSRRPDAESAAFVEGTYGSDNRHDFRGASNFTLVPDKLFARLTGLSRTRDGYVDRMDYACTHPGTTVATNVIKGGSCRLGTLGGQNVQALRAQLRWMPSESLDINLSADITDDRSSLTPNIAIALPGVNGAPGAQYVFPNGARVDASFLPPDHYTTYATFAATNQNNSANNAGLTAAGFTSFTVPDSNSFKGRGGSLDIEWKIAEGLNLQSTTAYRQYSNGFGADADETPFDYQTIYNFFRHRQFSEELRLSGQAAGGAVDWALGGYYFDSRSWIGGRVHIPGTFDMTPNEPVDVQNTSGFLHAAWHINDAMNLTAGFRYTDDSKDYRFSRFNATSPTTVSPLLGAIHGRESHYKGTHSDYKVALDYRWSPAVMGYVQWSTGFRGGGTAPRPFFGNQITSFKPETLNAYEVGLKTDLLEGRLRLNGSVFVNKYDDIILTATGRWFNPDLPINNNPVDPLYNPTTGTAPAAIPVNAGKATFKGAELEMEWLLGSGLRIDASLSWIDFGFDKLDPKVRSVAQGGSCPSNCITLGTDWLYTPEWKGSIGMQWEFGAGDSGATLTPRIDVSSQGSLNTRMPESAYSRLGGYTVANARLTWRSASKDWESSLEVTNLTDHAYFLNSLDLTSIGGIAAATVAPPRQWAVSVKRKF
jgi:iron complex outermembrane receptor protein